MTYLKGRNSFDWTRHQ